MGCTDEEEEAQADGIQQVLLHWVHLGQAHEEAVHEDCQELVDAGHYHKG